MELQILDEQLKRQETIFGLVAYHGLELDKAPHHLCVVLDYGYMERAHATRVEGLEALVGELLRAYYDLEALAAFRRLTCQQVNHIRATVALLIWIGSVIHKHFGYETAVSGRLPLQIKD